MYTLLPKPVSTARLEGWGKSLGRFREVVGFTAFGSFLLRDPDDNQYVVLHPLKAGNNASGLGKYASTAELEAKVLRDPQRADALLRPADFAQLHKRLGPLAADEVYYPVPYPMLGGSGALSTYDKGNAWVFASLVGQALGMGDDDDDDDDKPRAAAKPKPKIPVFWQLMGIVVFIAICFFLLRLLN